MNTARRMIVLLALSMAACTSGPGYEALRKEPTYQLMESGSVDIGLGLMGHDPSWSPTGQNDGATEKILGSSTTMDEIIAFYDRELTTDGWERGVKDIRLGKCSGYPDTGWQKGDLNISLGFFDELPSVLGADEFCLNFLSKDAFEQHATLYEVVMSYNPHPYRPTPSN